MKTLQVIRLVAEVQTDLLRTAERYDDYAKKPNEGLSPEQAQQEKKKWEHARPKSEKRPSRSNTSLKNSSSEHPRTAATAARKRK